MLNDYLRKGSATNRFFAILFSVVLVVGLVPISAMAEDDTTPAPQDAAQQVVQDTAAAAAEDPAATQDGPAVSADDPAELSEVAASVETPAALNEAEPVGQAAQVTEDPATQEGTVDRAEESAVQPGDEGLSTQALTTMDHVTTLTADPSTLSNGTSSRLSIAWNTVIVGTEQAYFHAGDVVTFDTNIGTLFDFTAPVTQEVRDPSSGVNVGTLTVTADKMTVEFNQAAEDMRFTQYGGYYVSPGSVFKAKALQTTATTLTKELKVGDATTTLTWPGLKKSVRPVVIGNGSISPGIITSVPDGSSETFTFTPSDGEELKSVTLVKPDGTSVPITSGISATGGSYTANGTELDLGESKLIAEFTTKTASPINAGPLVKENWYATLGDSARLNIFVNGDTTTNLYKNKGASLDAGFQKNQLLFEDTLPGKGSYAGVSIKALLPDWSTNSSGDCFPAWAWGGFEWANSADMTGAMNKLTQYSSETYDQFKARVAATPMNWGVYTGTDEMNTLVINFGSPEDPAVAGPKCSDYWAGRMASDAMLNTIAGDGNCVGGKVQYFAINYYAQHKLEFTAQHYTNTATIAYAGGNASASAEYDIDYSSAFQVGAAHHLVVNKVEEGNLANHLAGAEFKLQIKDPATGNWVDYTQQSTTDVVSGTTGDGNGGTKKGQLDMFTLIQGEYRLVETKAPAGYDAASVKYSTLDGSAGTINEDGTFVVTGAETTGFGAIVSNAKTSTPTYNVYYDKNAADATGTLVDPQNPYAKDDKWTVLSPAGAIERPGYRFTGWNELSDGTGKRYPVSATYMMKEQDITLYAQWAPKAAKAVASPNVTKAFSTDSDTRTEAQKVNFNFEIEQLSGEKTAVSDLTNSATQKDAGTLTAPFGPEIKFAKAGTYTFKISEKNDNANGYTYDDTTYTWTVTLTENTTGYTVTANKLTNDKTGEEVTGGAIFTNEFSGAAAADPIASPTVAKAINGTVPAGEDKTFTFTCAPAATNPAGGVTGLGATASITGAGDKTNAFGDAVTFSKAGTYKYTIAETHGSDTGYTYDTTTYTWTVVVAANAVGDKLVATGKLTKTGETTEVAKAGFTNTYAATTGDTYTVPTVTKNATGGFLSATPFTFVITGDDGAPMPTTTSVVATVNPVADPATATATANFGTITYTAAGTYTYHVTETNSGVAGWTYDGATYDIEVVVKDTNATLSAVGTVTKAGVVESGIVFNNTYVPESVTLTDPPVSKTISGTKPASADEFTFKMVGASGAPMPDDAVGDTVIRTLKGEGSVEMGYIDYKAAGTYTYKISEVAGTSKNYTYDTTVFDMTVVVTDNNGKLEATRTIEKNGALVAAAEFVNEFRSGLDVETNKVADKVDATPGAEIVYTITVVNTGDSKAVGVWVKDTVPAGTTFVSCDENGKVSDDKTYVNWFIAELEPGEENARTYTMTVRVNDDIATGTKVTNTAKFEVTANPTEPDFTTDPAGEETPTASTEVKPGQGANPAKAVTPATTKAASTAAAAGKSASTGDNALAIVALMGTLAAAGCAAFAARRRKQD